MFCSCLQDVLGLLRKLYVLSIAEESPVFLRFVILFMNCDITRHSLVLSL
jgi:hypothetical protein